MELLILVSICLMLIGQFIVCWILLSIEKTLDNLEPKKPAIEEPPKVTDPFQKPKHIYSSTSHIVVPKTPTEIRNQNFNKIKQGIEYGDIKREE